jgi:hypothetical protein
MRTGTAPDLNNPSTYFEFEQLSYVSAMLGVPCSTLVSCCVVRQITSVVVQCIEVYNRGVRHASSIGSTSRAYMTGGALDRRLLR